MTGDSPPIPDLAPRWEQIPEHLYKYRPVAGEALEWLTHTIERGEVYWPAPIDFNDPFDCAPKYLWPDGKFRRQLIDRVAKSASVIGRSRAERRNLRRNLRMTSRADMEARFDSGMDAVLKESAVYSMSTDPENILMWSHYGESHSGVCLRLRAKPLFEQFETGHWITYEEERPKVRIGQESERDLLRKILFTKAHPWHYEAEWRMVHYRGGRGVRRLNPNILDGIILGSRAKEATEEAVFRAIERSEAKIQVMRAVEEKEEYRLTLKNA